MRREQKLTPFGNMIIKKINTLVKVAFTLTTAQKSSGTEMDF